MSITKDGFHKHIPSDGTNIGNDNYLLLAGGGHIQLGNNVNQVPISNTTLSTGLNADMLDGVHADELLTYFSTNGLSSNENTLTLLNTYLTIGGSTYYTDIKTAPIINSLSISRLSSDATTNLTIGITVNGVASSDKTLTDLYAKYAAQLLNARNITIGLTTRSFNGTANISWALADILGTSDIGSTTEPIYYNGTNFVKLNYSISSNINAGTKNTLAYYSAINTISSYTGNVGSGIKLFYLNSGVPTESNSTVGATNKPIYLNNGTLTASTSTIGSGIIPIYMSSGVLTASDSTIGASNKPIFLSSGTLTASTSTIGSGIIPMFISSGTLTASSSTVGTSTKPIYLNAGTLTVGSYELKATVNNGTANRIAWYNGANSITSGSIVTDGGYLGSVGYLSINTAHQTSYRLRVNGDTGIYGTVSIYPNQNTTSSTAWTYPGGGYYATLYPNIRLIGDNDHGISTIEFVSQKLDTTINKPSDCAFIQFNPYGISAQSAVASQPTLATSGEINRLIIGVSNDANDQLWLQTPAADGLRHIVGTANYRILTTVNTYVSSNKGYINGTEITQVNNSDTVDGIHANGLFTVFSNAGTQTTRITIGGTQKDLKIDADMTDGLHVHGGRNNEANKIVRTDGNGYIQAGWINTTSGDMGTGAIDRVYCSNDAYIRYKTKANFVNGLDAYWANIKVSASSNTGTSPTFSTCYTSNWFRSTGATGWYSESYGGGIRMTDTSWIRTYGSKNFYVEGGNFAVSGNAAIGTTSFNYRLYINGDSYATGWSRAGSGFYCEGTGVHYTHKGNFGEINTTSANQFMVSASAADLHINYQAVSRGTLVTRWYWNCGSASTWAGHDLGYLNLFPTSRSNYGEGIRIHTASNGWTTLALCGTDNTGDGGTSANTWTLHTNGGNFYLNKNNSSGATVNRLWARAGGGFTFGNTANASYVIESAGDIRTATGWFRSTGAYGWYSESYGGGWYMTDSTYVRVYNSKAVYTANSTYYAYNTAGGFYGKMFSLNTERYILKPWGANFVTTTSSYKGAITITLPAGIGNTMTSMWIDVYLYSTNQSFSVHVGGYTYSNSTWANNPFAMVYGANHTVRLGHNGTSFIIYIGETNSTWSYPQITVRDVILGFSPSFANWSNQWTIGFSTSFSNVTATITNYVFTTKNTAKPNIATANRIAWYNGTNSITSSSIVTDGGYLGSVSYLSVNTGHQTSYRAYINGNSLLAGTTYFGTTSYWINNGGVEYMYDIRGSRIRLVDNWVGFYTSNNASGNRLGYIQTDGSYMYFRKENGNNGFNFNGNLVPASNCGSNIGINALSWNRTFTRYLDTRHLDATAEYTGDMNLYIGYGAATPTQNTYFYYSTGNRNAGATSRTHYATINANGMYAHPRFGVNGQNNSYNLYVNGSSDFANRLIIDTTGRAYPYSTGTRRAGMYGVYDSTKIGHIWSMGTSYMIPDNGANFGNLYGLAYKHTNNTTGGTMAGGHQAVWCDNGNPRAAMGYNGFWAAGGFYKNGSSDSYVLLGGGGHVALSNLGSSHSHAYLPLAGGTMNSGAQILVGTKSKGSSDIYNGGIQLREATYSTTSCTDNMYDAPGITFHWGGWWVHKLNMHSNALYWDNDRIVTMSVGDGRYARLQTWNNMMHSGNEYTFAAPGYSGGIWINWRTASGSTNGNITTYYFGRGNGSHMGFYIDTGGAYHTSDIRKKYDIRDVLYKDVIDLFNTENGYIRHFKWKESNKPAYGFIAQEIQEYCPECVNKDDQDYLSVEYDIALSKIVGVLFKKAKEQDRIIKEQDRMIKELQRKIEDL